MIDSCYRQCGQKATVLLADHLRTLGYQHATKAGISIAIKDMKIPEKKRHFIESANDEVREVENDYIEGVITWVSVRTRLSISGRGLQKNSRMS